MNRVYRMVGYNGKEGVVMDRMEKVLENIRKCLITYKLTDTGEIVKKNDGEPALINIAQLLSSINQRQVEELEIRKEELKIQKQTYQLLENISNKLNKIESIEEELKQIKEKLNIIEKELKESKDNKKERKTRLILPF